VKPVRVAFVSPHALPGGAERYLELLMGALGPEWIAGAVTLQPGELVGRLQVAGHSVQVVPTGTRLGILTGAMRLRRALRALEPDVVHANGIKAALVAGIALAGTRVPIVWVKHDFAWDGRLGRLTGLLCRRIVGVSEAVTEALGPRLRARVRVIPNGLPPVTADAGAGRRRLEEMLECGPQARVVLALGRIHPVKGTLDLVRAAATVNAERPSVCFALVGVEDPGEPAYPPLVRREIARLGLEGVVRLLGHRDDALDLVAGADVLAVPSGPPGTPLRGEGFGLVALEGMAVGTPVVAYSAGALPEVLGDCGLLVTPGDTQALAKAIVRALDDTALRSDLARRGRARVAERFSLARVVEEMRACYLDAAGR
jgi:glycosyltransferase involved in cell wall biosynthesis